MRRIFGFLVILLLFTITPLVHAQVSIGEKAVQKSVEVSINSEGDVHVKHVIQSSNLPKQVELIYGTVSNLKVTDESGEEPQFSVIGDYNGVLLMPSQEESIIEYDLEHVLSQKDNVWTWSFRYLETTSFIFPEEVDIIFANEKPVFLDDKRGIACHGCQMLLEYSIDVPIIFKNVQWEDKKFLVGIQSYANIDEFVFDQPTKSISLEVFDENKFVTIIIPLELLWGPYAVFLDDEKIYFNQYINNGTHVWLNMRPESSGEISIIGTTVVPEFPIIAPLAIGFLMIIILPIIRKVNLH